MVSSPGQSLPPSDGYSKDHKLNYTYMKFDSKHTTITIILIIVLISIAIKVWGI